ncbi:MAG: hydroxymethylpyrimidine/phosphomethylpyrimidine kinase [Spongiibacteraceae bacterium]|jgi:hydroxymethylpyrimidine/phosphomethylpyrimidine kinase|nr:hydroxymethylpyrimidine/phosphomethylpyrimidine kinase [Spongiibacteraceae bacterium]
MGQSHATQPVVLTINSHDPTGGAGLVADVETTASLGCHCVSALTAVNVRDTEQHKDRLSNDTSLLIEQIRAALEDTRVGAIKIGDVATVAQAEALHTILREYDDIPVVLDPSLNHGASDGDLETAVRMLLLPRSHIAILSAEQLHQLASCGDNIAACAQELLEYGGEELLITGTEMEPNKVVNGLYNHRGLAKQYHWEALPDQFHGAGSTLSAAIAAYLAHGSGLLGAVQQGQQFTWQALVSARRLGMGKLIPDRLFWSRQPPG